jgi:hypothetical protein
MKDQCPWESRVASAAQNQPLPTELAEHVSACELCRASLSVALSLREWAAEDIPDRTLGARFLWLVAQERLTAQRAARMQFTMLCAALVVVAMVGIAAWKWQLLGPGANTGGIAAALVIAVLFANWFASDNASLIHQ